MNNTNVKIISYKDDYKVTLKNLLREYLEYTARFLIEEPWKFSVDIEKELDKTFGTKKQALKQGHPYVWHNNWRTDNRLFGGWAMWYFIGKTTDGKYICGYETIYTTDNLLN